MRRSIYVNFGLAFQWENREEITGGEGAAAEAGPSAQSDFISEQAGRRTLIKRSGSAAGADHREKQLMSTRDAEADGTRASSSTSCSAQYGVDDHDDEENDNDEAGNDDNKKNSSGGGMLLKCMCSSVLLLSSITALLILLPLLLPAPLPPPPVELLLLPLLILLLLMCLAISPPSSPSSNL